jgi:hypothetical protein
MLLSDGEDFFPVQAIAKHHKKRLGRSKKNTRAAIKLNGCFRRNLTGQFLLHSRK